MVYRQFTRSMLFSYYFIRACCEPYRINMRLHAYPLSCFEIMAMVCISHLTSRLSSSVRWEFGWNRNPSRQPQSRIRQHPLTPIHMSSKAEPCEGHESAAPPTPSPVVGSLSPAIIRQRFTTRQDADSIVEPDGLNYLRVWIGLEDGTTDTSQPVSNEVVFISVDLENVRVISWSSKPDMAGQLGMAMLDTRCLSTGIDPASVITTYNCASGSAKYVKGVTKKFLFGKTVRVFPKTMAATLQGWIPDNRAVVFVGHSPKHDIDALRRLKFVLPQNTLAFLDTGKMAREMLNIHYTPSLQDLLMSLRCPCSNLHTAGNDAHFAMRAMLAMAARTAEKNDKAAAERLRVIEAIALGPISGTHVARWGAKKEDKGKNSTPPERPLLGERSSGGPYIHPNRALPTTIERRDKLQISRAEQAVNPLSLSGQGLIPPSWPVQATTHLFSRNQPIVYSAWVTQSKIFLYRFR